MVCKRRLVLDTQVLSLKVSCAVEDCEEEILVLYDTGRPATSQETAEGADLVKVDGACGHPDSYTEAQRQRVLDWSKEEAHRLAILSDERDRYGDD